MSPRKPLSAEQREAIATAQRAKHAGQVANPPHVADPLVRQFFQLLSTSGHSINSVSPAAGMAANTVRTWRQGGDPKLTQFNAGLNTIGHKLIIVPVDYPEVTL
jgi:hypothetical protein